MEPYRIRQDHKLKSRLSLRCASRHDRVDPAANLLNVSVDADSFTDPACQNRLDAGDHPVTVPADDQYTTEWDVVLKGPQACSCWKIQGQEDPAVLFLSDHKNLDAKLPKKLSRGKASYESTLTHCGKKQTPSLKINDRISACVPEESQNIEPPTQIKEPVDHPFDYTRWTPKQWESKLYLQRGFRIDQHIFKYIWTEALACCKSDELIHSSQRTHQCIYNLLLEHHREARNKTERKWWKTAVSEFAKMVQKTPGGKLRDRRISCTNIASSAETTLASVRYQMIGQSRSTFKLPVRNILVS
ncbi:hypothetical protein EJ05DRAFT_304815 [Pseudovirgaria hyperparasitica]|uniref:Uncharacterized protein n=1 Tax=Pseudovirgaria hyperparasitica TaxID=470096 RepID=A0A6A6WAP2_9PEZI|nr:uncharacterized protein EJ05DRAFT_304815 [Pseudovirgaria hyperparasitica]KAF2759635.1 hypothetical protein EJ05DRAFT_304815 [Pseudovirgaria hyperparasitica]